MRSYSISGSLESVQEIQDVNTLSTPMYPYRVQTENPQVYIYFSKYFIYNKANA